MIMCDTTANIARRKQAHHDGHHDDNDDDDDHRHHHQHSRNDEKVKSCNDSLRLYLDPDDTWEEEEAGYSHVIIMSFGNSGPY